MREKSAHHRGRFGLWWNEEDGVSATEYAIMLALIVVVSMAVIQSIGSNFQRLYLTIANTIDEATKAA